MDEPGSGWICRPEGSPAEEQTESRAGSVRQKGCGKGFAAHASPAALLGAAAMGCQQQVPHGPPQPQRHPVCSHTHTHTTPTASHPCDLHPTVSHPMLLKPCSEPQRSITCCTPESSCSLFHGNGHSSSHLPTQHPQASWTKPPPDPH